jgi:hypothetical protein
MSDETPKVDPAAPAVETPDEHKIHSSSDRLPSRPFTVTLENGTVVEHN